VLLEKVEQVVRLIRSKGVGVYFITQSPLDIPESVLGQLGNRVQHALRAFTPKDQKTVRAAANTFRPNPKLDTEGVIKELGVGEALASVLDAKGKPTPVERILVAPPGSQLGPITPAQRQALMRRSLVQGVYEQAVDRESAYEILQRRAEEAAEAAEQETAAKSNRSGGRQGMFEAFAKSALRSIGSQIGRQLARGMLGSLLGGRKR
jgi:DNA helicase HerA-like ATPase